LHNLGYIHRDLKPENIVLSLDRPIRVALIDFDRSLPKTNVGHTGTRGTPSYEPEKTRWHDG
jgi:serine/threonine protein kinase